MKRVFPSSILKLSVVERYLELPRRRRSALLRAVTALALAKVAVAVLPFRMAIRFGSSAKKGRADMTAEDCVWAIETAARNLPWQSKCIQKGLALQRLLRGHGVDAMLHYGARHGADGPGLEAHVWVSVAGGTVIGGEEAGGFAEIATFP